MKISEAIGRLNRLKATLEMPTPFYRLYLPEWRRLAAEVLQMTLTNAAPPEADRELWEAQILRLMERVTAKTMTEPAVGALISLTAQDEPNPDPAAPSNFALGDLSIDDVERWVAAGRAKEDPSAEGKNLDERDANKSDLQIAWRVMFALIKHKPGAEGLMAAITGFLGLEARDAMTAALPMVLQMWGEAFLARASSDWREWVDRQARLVD